MTIICKIPDSVLMTREKFKELLRSNSTASQLGFSAKHTNDITDYRKKVAGEFTLPTDIYNLPVTWNVKETYFAK